MISNEHFHSTLDIKLSRGSLENAVTKMPTPEMSHFLIVHTPSPREESTKRRLVKGSKTR